jgi:hypothetical protein
MTFPLWPRSPRKPIRPPARARLAVEQLEERAVPTTFEVFNLDDSGSGSLRQAILNANGATTDAVDVIDFQPGLSGTIRLTSGELLITGSVVIHGPGAGVLTVSGNEKSRIFEVAATGPAIDVTISGLTLTQGNAGVFDDGGAIRVADETLVLSSVLITDNAAGSAGGGIDIDDDGRLTLENSTVRGNISGSGHPGGGIHLGRNSVALIRNSTISNNSSGNLGGGIYVDGGALTVENSTILGNSAEAGGGILVSGGTLTVQNTTISENSTFLAEGGGIAAVSGKLTVTNSTISTNSTPTFGGGIIALRSTLTVENSTISGNSADKDGGGINILEEGTAVIRNSTIAFNTGGGQGGGLFVGADAPVALQSTLVADNAVGASGSDPDVSGAVTATFSLVENVTGTAFLPGSANNLTGADPLLGPLADNGGPTKTHALLPGSPALDHGFNPFGLAFDQRGPGFARALGAAADIGAFEATPTPPPPAPSPQIVAVAFRQRGVSRVRVKDAATGAVRAVLTPFRGFGGRLRLLLLDVNGDGAPDLVVRALVHGKRRKRVFDAVTLAPLPPGLA